MSKQRETLKGRLREFTLDFRRESDVAKNYVEEDLEDFFEEAIEAKVYELYGAKETSWAI